MFFKGMHLSVFYCLCYDTNLTRDYSEEQVVEERDPDLNEMDDIRFDEIQEDHWRYLVEESNNKKKIHALRWCVYVKEKEDRITRSFSVSVPHPKGGKIVWTCVKYHVIEEKEYYKEIGLRGFDYSLFEEKKGGGTRGTRQVPISELLFRPRLVEENLVCFSRVCICLYFIVCAMIPI